ncbi:unnamed protein product [Linum tenue]|uniref:Uncharacterized protein n=1 Tax=Linum tenue TaxID=586396 RepID=A0AAV0R358_9ROSI|nr:unnamed protein product [Linum tenue]
MHQWAAPGPRFPLPHGHRGHLRPDRRQELCEFDHR